MALTKIKADGLTADLIDETKLADNSIDSEHYNDGSIDNAHLADDAVGVAELSATGTASSSTFLRGDNSWAAVTSTTINNNADNKIITGSDTANTLEGEANLTYNGTRLNVATGDLAVTGAEGGDAQLRLTADEGDDGADYWRLESNASTNNFNLATYSGGSWEDKFSMNTSGNLMLGTSTKGAANGDDLTIAGSGHRGITIRSTDSSDCNIYFSDGTSGADEYRGYLAYVHSDNSLRIGADGSEKMRISSAGAVGINDTNPSDKLSVVGTTNFNGNSYIGGDLYMYGSSYTKGIFLGGSATANKLDDYEEGQYTPSVTGSTGQTDVSVYSTENKLNYTKIGNLVNISGRLRMETVSYSGGLVITLPFTAEASTNTSNASMAAVATHGADFDSSAGTGSHMGMWLEIGSNSAYAYFIVSRDNSAWINASNSIVTAGTYLAFTYTYRAA